MVKLDVFFEQEMVKLDVVLKIENRSVIFRINPFFQWVSYFEPKGPLCASSYLFHHKVFSFLLRVCSL
jgi:hypothetical protein